MKTVNLINPWECQNINNQFSASGDQFTTRYRVYNLFWRFAEIYPVCAYVHLWGNVCPVKTHFKRSVFQQLIFLFATVNICQTCLGWDIHSHELLLLLAFLRGGSYWSGQLLSTGRRVLFEKMDIRSRLWALKTTLFLRKYYLYRFSLYYLWNLRLLIFLVVLFSQIERK